MKNILKIFLLFLSALTCKAGAVVADYDVVPLPDRIESVSAKGFLMNGNTVIVIPENNDRLRSNAELLADYMSGLTGLKLAVTTKKAGNNTIVLSDDLKNDNSEAYRISVDDKFIRIEGASPAGCFYGIQTLRKSVPATEIADGGGVMFPAVRIDDAPRFGYRGSHLDCSRHFFAADSVKKFIDILALHNINRFHWHLSDDQGWRIEIKKYPRLTEVGSKRGGTIIGLQTSGCEMKFDSIPYGGYYTQEEIRDIVDYAAQRYINVIPEIDLPGHMLAALTAYPELGCTGGPYEVWQCWGVADDVLCAGNPKTIEFIDGVLEELMDLFPSEYIHLGGDECPKDRWQDCPRCQAKIRELGLADEGHPVAEHKLQNKMMEHFSATLASRGRKMIGWDEILEGGLFPGACVMAWRGADAAAKAAKQGHDAILTPTHNCYLDYTQSAQPELEPLTNPTYLPIEQVYNLEPVLPGLSADEAKHILGAQVNLWSEYVPSFWIAMYDELPRLAALSEVTWSKPEAKDFQKFRPRLRHLMKHYDNEGYNYCREVYNVFATVDISDKGSALTLGTLDNAPVYYTLDGSEPDENSLRYTEPIAPGKTCDVRAVAIRDGVKGRQWKGRLNASMSFGSKVSMLSKSHPRFTFNGPSILNDGLYGTRSFGDGSWIGFGDEGLDVVFDLGEQKEVSRVRFNTLVSTGSWIFDCHDASVEISTDGVTYTPVASEEYETVGRHTYTTATHEMNLPSQQARYVRVKINPLRSMPEWHGGSGYPALLFVDEIEID